MSLYSCIPNPLAPIPPGGNPAVLPKSENSDSEQSVVFLPSHEPVAASVDALDIPLSKREVFRTTNSIAVSADTSLWQAAMCLTFRDFRSPRRMRAFTKLVRLVAYYTQKMIGASRWMFGAPLIVSR